MKREELIEEAKEFHLSYNDKGKTVYELMADFALSLQQGIDWDKLDKRFYNAMGHHITNVLGWLQYQPEFQFSYRKSIQPKEQKIDWDEPIVIKIKKSSFKDSDRATAFFLKVKEMKIKVEEPKSKSNGLYETFIIHLDTVQKKIVFAERFLNVLKQQPEFQSIPKEQPKEQKELTETQMFENMQYYMEYCQRNGYVTPMEWIKEHKHF